MTNQSSVYEELLSDEILSEGAVASDVGSLWRRLARTSGVRNAARDLSSDPVRIERLCSLVQDWRSESYDRAYLHPKDMAICAALVCLESSPLPVAKGLFARLRRAREPSLIWVRRMAEHCAERATESAFWGGPWMVASQELEQFHICTDRQDPDDNETHWGSNSIDSSKHLLVA